jgi:hypothetical protein
VHRVVGRVPGRRCRDVAIRDRFEALARAPAVLAGVEPARQADRVRQSAACGLGKSTSPVPRAIASSRARAAMAICGSWSCGPLFTRSP